MSNRARLDRLTITTHKDSQITPTLKLYDDNGEELYPYFELPNEDLECLKNVIETWKKEQWEANQVLQRIYDNKMSISIDDIHYSWGEIEHLFKDWWQN